MNLHSLTRDEAAFILFSFKKTLRDRTGLTPTMVQFYENAVATLRQKIERIDGAIAAGRSLMDDKRDRAAQVENPWPSN